MTNRIRYRLRASAPEFQIMDGPLKGRTYRHGEDYDLDAVPGDETGVRNQFSFARFEPVPDPSASAQPSAPVAEPEPEPDPADAEIPEPDAEAEEPRRPRRKAK